MLVGLCVRRSVDMVAALLAIFKVGAVYLPLDPDYPPSRLHFMLADSQVSIVLAEQDTYELMHWREQKVVCLDGPQSHGNVQAAVAADCSQAYVIYTSGSTGQPKGVIGSHAGLSNRLMWMQHQFVADHTTVFAARTSISFVDHVAELLQPICFGAKLVLLPGSDTVAGLAGDIARYQINRLTLVPSRLALLLGGAHPGQLASLTQVISSGEALSEDLVNQFYQRCEPHAVLLNLYGSTEVGADVTCHAVQHPLDHRVLAYFSEQQPEQVASDDIYHRLVNSGKVGEDTFTQPNVELDSLRDKFSDTAIPEQPVALGNYLDHLQSDLLPYTVDVSRRKYIGHMTSALPNFIPEFSRLIAKYNQNIVKIETSKSMTLMERQVLAMVHRLFYRLPESHYEDSIQDPDHLHGIITSGGSLANITSLYCARNKGLMALGATRQQLVNDGAFAVMQQLGYKDAVILVSRLAHYSVKKAAALLGIGQNSLIIIEQDERQRVKTAELEAQIQACREQKRFIIAIIGIAGATETGTIDPLDDMADIAERHNIHFHADAAWGGAFMFSDMYRYKFKGIERADSITFCAHKQLYLAQGISLCVFKDPKSVFAVTTHADYQAAAGSFDLGQFTIEGSRPATSLMLHASLNLLGRAGYAWLVEQGMAKTADLRQMIEHSPAFELVGDNDLNIINYRYLPRAIRHCHGNYSVEDNKQICEAVRIIQQAQFPPGRVVCLSHQVGSQSFR